ncbi:hypothetical protein DNHGIG_19430 [Collibacillus ludicampi]|uniref:RDD domain-containing protein n=1 Tax=Collibacillus ludicampi TaxID=2771369 RepID=A0AAV4LEY9_9BACL|nr:RDD family protein [Collibacillus ludicampi]GIM46394.1 hypothetical protein DNHGIG_19430 [Collibacillus ludicampi]
MEHAGFWLRLIAFVIDSILVLSIGFILYFIFGVSALAIVAHSTKPDDATAYLVGAFFLYCAFLIVSTWMYFACMESSPRQGTLGKLVVGLHVSDANGCRISFWRATGRFFGKFISGILFCIGFLMTGWTQKKQALHDLMAGTIVFKGSIIPVLLLVQTPSQRTQGMPLIEKETI